MKMNLLKLIKKSKAPEVSKSEEESILCDKLNFSAAEAYKLLRTNLTFTLTDNKECHIIGITSATRGEGKSTTSINLSYSLAEAGKRVLLIEADMRLPAIARRLNIKKEKGLSNLLAGQAEADRVLNPSGYFPSEDGQDNWMILAAGDIPPNPSELLGSAAMKKALEHYAAAFDFIVIDLPPVLVVSDALAVSGMTDGILMVARQGFVDKASVQAAVQQFRFSDARLLGFVLTCAGGEGKKYKSYKYKKYGYYRHRGYGYGYGYDSDYADGYGRRVKKSRKTKDSTENEEASKTEEKDGNGKETPANR